MYRGADKSLAQPG